MRKRILSQAFFSFLFVAVVLQDSKGEQAEDCSSSCGNVLNISHPFRLKGDPPNCGFTEYELSCEGDQPYLHLLRRKYAVIAIEYKRQMIRVVDYDLRRGNYSSLLGSAISVELSHTVRVKLRHGDAYAVVANYVITYLNCSAPIDSVLFVAANSCFNASSWTHYYAILPSTVNVSDLPPACNVVAKANVLKPAPKRAKKYNYTEVHEMLMMGFDLSWAAPLACRHCLMKNRGCYYYQLQQRLPFHCYPVDYYGISFLDIMHKRFWRAIGLYIISACVYLALCLMGRTCIGIFCLLIFLVYKLRTRKVWMDSTVEEFLSRHSYQTPTRYSYSDVRKMTRRFRDKLGQGGFGSVYKGKLRTGKQVAIKMLSAKSKSGGQDFINEVATIGRIHHVHVVRLIGFCAEGSKRALIYEFMPNGSLEKYIYPQEGRSCPLSWEKIHDIALGIARGIAYLHRGCDMTILHFDIKPHNILLDEKFIPRVSDFGLAKFYPIDESIVSITAVRGTVGYIAPELFYKNAGGVSYKSDVYSFGMLLMEMAGRRKNVNAFAKNSSQIYFPLWVYDKLNQGEDIGMEEADDDEKEVTKKMLIVALWCIQMKPGDRPSMTKVVEMLEGSLEQLHLPAKPFLSSPERAAEEDQEIDIDTPKSSSAYELGSTPQNGAESSDIHMILD